MAVAGTTPVLTIEVRVEGLFLHRSKAFARSSLWNAAGRPGRGDLPSTGFGAGTARGSRPG